MKTIKLFEDLTLSDAMLESESVIEQFLQMVRERKIVIYGAALIGTVLYKCLCDLTVEVANIIDRDAEQIGELEGFTVETPAVLHGLESEADKYLIVLAVSSRTEKSVLKDLAKISDSFTVLSNGEKIVDCLKVAICATNHNRGADISHAYCGDCSVLDNICPALRKRGKDILDLEAMPYDKTKSANVKMIGYILGNVCSLNCKHCCESVPLFPRDMRRFVDTDIVIKDIERLAGVSEFITIAEFIGGEPFMHPGLPEIIKRTLEIKNIAFVRVFTNGTITPSDRLLEALSNPRAAVYISNYTGMMTDEMVEKVSCTKKILSKSNVAYIYGGDKKWFDFSSYDFRPDSDEELSRRFNACFLHNCNRLHNGVLYACPHHYAGLNIGHLNNFNETINIHEMPDVELVEALERFKALDFVDACRYCDMPFNASIILPAESMGNKKQ